MIKLSDLDSYLEFKNYNGFARGKVIDYILKMYSRDSRETRDLVATFKELRMRKVHVMGLVGLDVDDEKVLAIVENRDLEVLGMIDCFLSKVQYSNEWEMYVSYQEAFWEGAQRLRKPIETLEEDKEMVAFEKKVKLVGYIKLLDLEISNLGKTVFGDNDDIGGGMAKRVRSTVEKRVRDLNMVKKL